MTAEFDTLEVSRLIQAPRERVFAAWTDPTLIVQWWGAGGVVCTEAEMDLTVGGKYRIANRTPDGVTMWIAGTFRLVDPPAALAYTWAMEPISAETHHSLVEVSFVETEGGTLVTINHRKIDSHSARDTNLGGWTGCLDGLDELLRLDE